MTGHRNKEGALAGNMTSHDVFRPADYIFGAAIVNISIAITGLLQPVLSNLYPYTLAGPIGSLIAGAGLMVVGYHLKRSDHGDR